MKGITKMRKRFLSLLLCITVAAANFPLSAVFAQSATWDGTEKSEPVQTDNVYQISSGAELAWFADYVNRLGDEDTGLVNVDAVLTDDIDLGGKPWTPIGLIAYVVDAYAGTFDGQNHTVSNLKIDAFSSNYGLFGIVNTGTIKNLKVEGSVNSTGVAGGIIGKLQTGTVENCSFSGSVISTGTSTKGYAGGIIGTISSNNAVITGCCNTADISGSYAGGILGYSSNSVQIISCYNTGEITGKTRSAGISGQQSKGSISYCYNIGSSANGIFGFSNAAITNCYYLNDEVSAPGGTAAGCEKITDKASLLVALNAGTQGLFFEDTSNINGGYPVFEWQLGSAAAFVPVAEVNILGDAITGKTLTAQALGEDSRSATNVTFQWSVSEDNQNFTDIADSLGGTFYIPDTSEYAGKYIKVTASGEENSTASSVIGPIKKSDTLIEKENTEKVNAALASLSLETSVIKEASALNLPDKIGGCSVSWVSSNTEIISNAGIVTLPDKNIVTVTLTATVSCQTVSKSKKFNIDVWASNVEADVYLQKVLDSMKWDFKLLQPVYKEDTNILTKFQTLLKNRGFDGVTVTVKSTSDNNLISKNGKIDYPVRSGSSFADGRQVQVFFNLSVEDKTVSYPTSDIYSLLIPWASDDTEFSLQTSADAAITEDIIRGDNESLSAVTSDLNLPSCIDGDKYSFAWITWESSDEAHLSISNENRQNGADSLYNPYVGKIFQDSKEHIITLTATIKNPSTGITLTRTVHVTIAPLSAEQLKQNISLMKSILNCYTADKLTDFATKKPLNTDAVDGDIQLVIPKNVLTQKELEKLDYGEYWDYWNYKFTVSSSNTDVIEINGFRAYVYRPLGENSSCDKNVTLTVKIESKSNPNLYASKNITLTVKHLKREEINSALDLMDRAKTNYANGLLGSNSDTYSIIDNLTPYDEIVWNEEKSGVEFIYRHKDIKNNGIIVDELPGWQEQEDWRLFRTSNRDLISNETLILNQTPNEDTFVKINSVLTDEVFGKYYTKFQNDKNYDAESLAKFKQLYKQPVSAYVMAVGAGNYTEIFASMPAEFKESAFSARLSSFKKELDKPISVSFTLLGLNGETLIAKTQENAFTKGATVFDVFKKVLADNNITYAARGSYIYEVNGLKEFANGRNSGWMYTVGSVFVNSYMNAQELSGGEDIVVMYVTDYALANKKNDDSANSGDKENNSDSNINQSAGRENGETEENDEKSNSDKSDTSDAEEKDSFEMRSKSNASSSSEKSESKKASKASEDEKQALDVSDTNEEENEKSNLDNGADNKAPKITDNKKQNNKFIIICSVLGLLVLALVIAILLIKKRKNK